MNRSGLIASWTKRDARKSATTSSTGARLQSRKTNVKLGELLAEWTLHLFDPDEAGAPSSSRTSSPASPSKSKWTKSGLSQLVVTLPPGDEKHAPTILVRDSGRPYRKNTYALPRALDGAGMREVQPATSSRRSARDHQDEGHHRRPPRVVELFETASPRSRGHQRDRRRREIRRDQQGLRKITSKARTAGRRRKLDRRACTSTCRKATVKAGEPLIDGPLNRTTCWPSGEIHAGLSGQFDPESTAEGVNINDKHIETIVRQMMRWVKVEDVARGLPPRGADRQFRSRGERPCHQRCGRPRPGALLLASQGSLSTIRSSRRSFRRPRAYSRALSRQGGITARPKENVIMGRLIRQHASSATATSNCSRGSSDALQEEILPPAELSPEKPPPLDFLRKDPTR